MVSSPSPSHKDIFVFDAAISRARRNRIAAKFTDHDFLFDWSGRQLLDRLSDIKRAYERVLVLGLRQGPNFLSTLAEDSRFSQIIASDYADKLIGNAPNRITTLQTYEELLPFAPASIDLVLCNLGLHGLNDLPGTLLQIKRTLKPDGLFLASMLGGETLHELKSCLLEAELELTSGVSPRVAPFADKQDMGALMQRAGYALPVIDSERVTVTYENAFKLFADLRGMGESNILVQRSRTIPPRALFLRAAQIYAEKFAESDGRIVATFDIIFLLGWAPHVSQQQPLKPGSATSRLSDALGTTEIKT